MKKKILAVAIGSALAGAPMFANAAATLYGAVHLSVDSIDNGDLSGGTADTKLLTMSSNSSFIGIKAEDDLGGGMKGIVGAEFQMAFDAAANGIANRNVFAGVQGGFGTVKLGQMDDIVKNVGRKVDFFHSEQIGESRSLTAGNSMDARIANGVRYDSPKLGPVTLTAHYGFASDVDANQGQNLTNLAAGAELNMGGLYVGAAWKSRDIDAGATTDQTTATRLAASYAFGFGLTVGALYQKFEDDFNGIDLNVVGGGASYKIGNGVIKAQYYKADENASGANNGAKLVAVGYDHNLSKNTMVYAVYGKVENDPNGTFSIIGAGHSNPNDMAATDGGSPSANSGTPDAGAEMSAISVGIKVKF
jgi:predicted porin